MMEISMLLLCALSIGTGAYLIKMHNTIENLRREIETLSLTRAPIHEPTKPLHLLNNPPKEKKTMSPEQKRVISEKAKARWAKKKALGQPQRPEIHQLATAN